MFLSRYTVSKPAVIVELDPATGALLREFPQPCDWEWDPDRPHAHWEEYRGRRFYVYLHEQRLVFQAGAERHVLDASYSAEIRRVLGFWKRFRLRRNGAVVCRFTYRDPQSRWSSLVAAVHLDDDWWDWSTPFDFVHEALRARGGVYDPLPSPPPRVE